MDPDQKPQRRDAVDNRRGILDAARSLLADDPEASIEAIATAAGLSRRTMYGHFANREQLMNALAAEGAARVAAAVTGIEHPDPVVRLALIGARAFDEIASVRTLTVATLRSDRAAVIDHPLSPLRRVLGVACAEGIMAGRFRDDLGAERLARLIEDAVIAVVPGTLRDALDEHEARELVVTQGLATAGLGWREAAGLVAEHRAEIEGSSAGRGEVHGNGCGAGHWASQGEEESE